MDDCRSGAHPVHRNCAKPRRLQDDGGKFDDVPEDDERNQKIPIVFITGDGDRIVRPSLLAQGAVECQFKPFSETALLDALNAALRTMSTGNIGRAATRLGLRSAPTDS
jgi:CheY-like chemotaxis protein